MFNFTREDKQVKVSIEAKASAREKFYLFSWNCNDDVYAELLVASFKENLSDKVKKIREEAYSNGWRDAKAKSKKETYFGGWL